MFTFPDGTSIMFVFRMKTYVANWKNTPNDRELRVVLRKLSARGKAVKR